MNAKDILREVYRRGIILEVEGVNIRFRDPNGMLNPELKESIATNKLEILKVLGQRTRLDTKEFETVLDTFKTLQKWRNDLQGR